MRENTASPFRLLVFDWDGTLVDSIGTIVACTRQTLRELRLPEQQEDTIRRAIGLGLRETVDRIHPGCDEETFLEICRVYRRLWFDDYGRRPALFPGALELLRELREDYLLAVATAKGRLGLDLDFARLGLEKLFAGTRTVTEAPGKPDPTMLLELLAELRVTAGAALMIGDSTHDLRMARNAGVASMAVTTGSHLAEDLLEIGPLDCLAGVVELPGWLRRHDERRALGAVSPR